MKILALIASFFLVSQAQAAFFIEPYLGYYKGESKISGAESFDDAGFGYGMKLGFNLGSTFYVAGDLLLVKGEYDAGGGIKEDMEIFDYAAILGMNIGTFRVWGGYIFNADRERQALTTVTTYDGKGWKAGLGYILGRKVSINVEYIVNDVESVNGQDLESGNSIENSGIFASLSFPIGF